VLGVNESVESESVTASLSEGIGPAGLPQYEEPERVAESGPEHQRDQERDQRRVPWELLLFPALLVVQATWMAFLVYWALRALF
jgi:hypothetical protein